jgi:hypothetical protein
LIALRQPAFCAPSLAKLITDPAAPITTCLSLEGKRGMTRALLEVWCGGKVCACPCRCLTSRCLVGLLCLHNISMFLRLTLATAAPPDSAYLNSITSICEETISRVHFVYCLQMGQCPGGVSMYAQIATCTQTHISFHLACTQAVATGAVTTCVNIEGFIKVGRLCNPCTSPVHLPILPLTVLEVVYNMLTTSLSKAVLQLCINSESV